MSDTTSPTPPEESTAVTITVNALLLNDDPVVLLDNGEIDQSNTSSNELLVNPLFVRLQEEVDRQKRIALFRQDLVSNEVITIIADRHVPFKLLSQVMYTAGQAQFSIFKFAVIKRS